MAALYLDSSAVLAWLLDEPEGARIAERLESAVALASSALTTLEVERQIVRQVAMGLRNEAQALQLRGALARETARWTIVDIVPEVLARAARPFPVEPVRSLDAIHLATALELVAAYPELDVLTLDRRVADNARALGLGASG